MSLSNKITAVCISFALFLTSCASTTQYVQVKETKPTTVSNVFHDTTVVPIVATTTAITLNKAIKDPEKRQIVANYVDVYATALRSLTDDKQTPEQLSAAINTFIPKNVLEKHPEISAFASNYIAKKYAEYLPKIQGKPKAFLHFVNELASGLEYGAHGFVSATPTTVTTKVTADSKTVTLPAPTPVPLSTKKWWQVWK